MSIFTYPFFHASPSYMQKIKADKFFDFQLVDFEISTRKEQLEKIGLKGTPDVK
jgi:hypothetical protein